MNSITNAGSIRGHQLTPTQARAIAQHAAFHQKIAERAALLPPRPEPSPPAAPDPDPPWFHFVGFPPIARMTPMRRIMHEVCIYFRVKHSDLISARRTKEIIIPRQIAMYLCKELTRSSLPSIGRAMGGRDHTTILHGVRKITDLLDVDPALVLSVNNLRQTLNILP